MLSECISGIDGEVQKPGITASLHEADWPCSYTACLVFICLPVDIAGIASCALG